MTKLDRRPLATDTSVLEPRPTHSLRPASHRVTVLFYLVDPADASTSVEPFDEKCPVQRGLLVRFEECANWF